MDMKQIVMLALQLSILSTVFSFGLKATAGDLLYVLRRPRLLVRSLLAMFVIMPVLVIVLIRIFNFSQAVEVLLVSLAISPIPPLLPQRELKAGGRAEFGLGLMAFLAILSIASIPLELELFQLYFQRALSVPATGLAGVVLKAAIAPLIAGMLIHAFAPALAARIEPTMAAIGKILLPLAALVVLVGASSAIWALVGDGTVIALVTFVVAGLVIGHVLGGPDRDHSAVLALSTACRHPAIAFMVASSNFPEHHFGPLVLMYVLINGIVGIPYLMWQRRAVAAVTAG